MLTIIDVKHKYRLFGNIFTSLAVLCLAILLFGLFNGGKAHAETNTPIAATAPTPNSGTITGGGGFDPVAGVGYGSFSGDYHWYKIYVRNGQSTKVNINQTCNDVGSPTVQYWIESLSDHEQSYFGNQGNYWLSSTKQSSNCNDTIQFTIQSNYGISSIRTGHTDYHVFAFTAHILPGPGSAERYFRVTTTNNSNGNTYVGLASPDFSCQDWTLCKYQWSTIYRPSGSWGASVMFAPRCDVSLPSPATIKIFDVDNGIYQNNMHAYLERTDVLPYANNGTINWSTQTTWDKYAVQGGQANWGKSGTVGTLNFTPSYDYVYKFHVVESQFPNTIQIKLPFDQFDAKRTDRTDCYPPVTCTATASPSAVLPGGSSKITVNGFTTNGAPWPSSYYIKRGAPSYKDISSPGVSSGVDNVTLSATTQYVYHIASTDPKYTQNGQPDSWVRNETKCTVTVTIGNANFQTACDYTTVSLKTTANDYYDQNVSSGYWTAKTPDINSTPFQYPHIWNNTAPPNNTNDIKNDTPKPVPGQDYSVNPGIGGLLIWYYWVGTVRHYENPASEIPIYIQWQNAGGGNVGGPQYYMIKPTSGGSGSYKFNTYGTNSSGVTIDPGLIPHNAYSAVLYAQISGSFAKDSGSYQYSQVATSSLQKCLDANPSTVCVSGSGGGGGGIGTTVTLSYTIKLDNQTLKVFPNNFGYNMNFVLGPGLQAAGPTSANLAIPTGINNITGQIQATIIYTDSFSIQFRYGSTVLAYQLLSGNWDAQCGTVNVPGNAMPYLQAWNSDVSAGGGFRSSVQQGDGACGGTNDAPYITPSGTGDQNIGGIRAFGQQNYPNRGSRVDFGALALGMIIGSPSGSAGFFSGDGATGDHADFANTLSGYFSSNMGGYLNANKGHCVSDYFTDTKVSAPNSPTGSLSGDVGACTDRCQYTFTGANLTNGAAVTIPAGKQVTVYVDGDVTIDSNITYAPFNPTDPSNVPYFALIVRGNITLTGNVTRLDGLFVSQPRPPALPGGSWTGGEFITCDDNAGHYCNNQLVVNGAVIAQHLQLLRNHGTLVSPPAADAAITGNPAEIFNFTPSLIIGSPAFAQLNILPPTFSLPPVF